MIVADTNGLLALLDAGEPEHARASEIVAADRGPLVTTDFVLAETDYLVLRRLGGSAEMAFLEQVAGGTPLREPVSDADMVRALEILKQYDDQDLGLTDASLMAVAERIDVSRILTLDRRHFAPFRDRHGRAFELLPD